MRASSPMPFAIVVTWLRGYVRAWSYLSDVGDGVDETDFCREECVVCVLDEFSVLMSGFDNG